MQTLWYAAVGLGAGILGGWLGVGGGALMLPVMILWFGMRTEIAIGTSLACIVPIAASAATRHYLLNKVDANVFWPMALAGLAGGLIGAFVLDRVPTDWTKRVLAIFWVYSAFRLWMTTMPNR
jgi:hypothetical protein